MTKETATQPPGKSGYPEEQPRTNTKKGVPDSKTPHEPQNVPDKKPKP